MRNVEWEIRNPVRFYFQAVSYPVIHSFIHIAMTTVHDYENPTAYNGFSAGPALRAIRDELLAGPAYTDVQVTIDRLSRICNIRSAAGKDAIQNTYISNATAELSVVYLTRAALHEQTMSVKDMDVLTTAYLDMNFSATVTFEHQSANRSLLAAYREGDQKVADATTKVRQLHLALAWARTAEEIEHIFKAAATVISRLPPMPAGFLLEAIDCLCQAANVQRDRIRTRVSGWLKAQGHSPDDGICGWPDYQWRHMLESVAATSPAGRWAAAANANAGTMVDATAETAVSLAQLST